ncbi:MAG: cytochrome b [Burkholderiaceae bacterium]|nr:cytochrome b [Burkholderiaceae bacterium]
MHSDRYPASAIALHWSSAVLIAACVILGLVMTEIPGLTPTKLKYFSWHKWLGCTVLLLLAPRIALRLARPAPPLPAGMAPVQRRAAQLAHGALYALLLAVPLSGLLYSQAAGVPVVYFGVVPIPPMIAPDPQWKAVLKSVHWLLTYTLMALVALHVLAALKHQFIDRDNLLARMLPFTGDKK